MAILDELIDTMSRAYHKFSVIVNEYSDSCWAHDSKLKLKEIEKMTVRYAKIKESYNSEKRC